MDNPIVKHALRWLILLFAQVFLFKQMFWGWGGQIYLQVHIYPLFILLLPLRMPRTAVVLLGFSLGLAIDYLYESPGMHAGALVFTAYMRDIVLRIIAPREGYSVADVPTKAGMGSSWFLQYAASLVVLHLLFYYFLEAFTVFFWFSAVVKTIISSIASLFFILGIVYIFNPKA